MRIVYRGNARDHTNNFLFINQNAMKFLVTSNISVLRIFHFMDDNHCYITRQRGDLKQIYVRTALKAMCIYTVGETLWNSLSASQKNCHSISWFKKLYKSHIIDRHKGELHL